MRFNLWAGPKDSVVTTTINELYHKGLLQLIKAEADAAKAYLAIYPDRFSRPPLYSHLDTPEGMADGVVRHRLVQESVNAPGSGILSALSPLQLSEIYVGIIDDLTHIVNVDLDRLEADFKEGKAGVAINPLSDFLRPRTFGGAPSFELEMPQEGMFVSLIPQCLKDRFVKSNGPTSFYDRAVERYLAVLQNVGILRAIKDGMLTDNSNNLVGDTSLSIRGDVSNLADGKVTKMLEKVLLEKGLSVPDAGSLQNGPPI